MAFCENCGGEIADNAKFCTNCGAPRTPHMQAPDSMTDPFGQPALNSLPETSPAAQPDSYSQEGGYGQSGNYGQDAGFGQQNTYSQTEQETGFGSYASGGFSFTGGTAQDSSYTSAGGTAQDSSYTSAGGTGTASGYSSSDTSASVYGSTYSSAGGAAAMGEPTPGLTFVEAVQTCFSKFATFSGRARRSEYWYFVLFTFICQTILGFVGNAIFGVRDGGTNILQTAFNLAVLVPQIAVFTRRMHDIGKRGTWYLLVFVPIIGWFLILLWTTRDSTPGENEYGMSPKYPYSA